MSWLKCLKELDVKFHWAQCVKLDRLDSNQQAINLSNFVYLEVWSTFIGTHLTRELTTSTVLMECWNWELMLATNFGNPRSKVTNVVDQNFGHQLRFPPHCWMQDLSNQANLLHKFPGTKPSLVTVLFCLQQESQKQFSIKSYSSIVLFLKLIFKYHLQNQSNFV